jgi:murein DD-endopeptidase MepM/ murein hydrolase activator NlpD
MRRVNQHTSAGRLFSAESRAPAFFGFFKTLVWLWVLSAVVAIKPSGADAAKQKTVRKEVGKGKPVPSAAVPVRSLNKAQTYKALLRQPAAAPIDPLEKREQVVQRTKRGDTLPGLVSRLHLSQTEKQLWTRSIRRNFGPQPLPSGREIHFYFSKPGGRGRGLGAIGQLKAVEVDYSDASTLTWEKGIRGILFQKREKPYDVELKTASATVEDSLFDDGKKAGIQPALLSQLVDIFNWDVDLEKDMHRGDSFKILYEKRSRNGQDTKASLRILAAELSNAGQKFTAIYFEKQKGQGNYYNLEGRSLARSFLRFPLEFTSITSYFSHARFHPLLKTQLPHTGVDFAAQRGTPVRAVGDGVIIQSGWNGAYGKEIDIQHDSVYMTRYAHLEGFAQGIHEGVAVKKGQVIGYVGSTGRSTGPHLHFELYKDRQYVDPLSSDFPADETIEPALQKLFDNQKQLFLVELTSTPQS